MKRGFTVLEGLTVVAILAIIAAIFVAHNKPGSIPVEKPLEMTAYKVTSQGTFRAGYDNNIREVLILEEVASGRTFLCITGCGVTEFHTEQQGKIRVTKEE